MRSVSLTSERMGFWQKRFPVLVLVVLLSLGLWGCEPLDPDSLRGHLETREGQPVIVLDNGDTFQLMDEEFMGYVGHVGFDAGMMVLPGWAVDTQLRRPVTAVVVMVNDVIVASTAPDRDRDHVPEQWGEQANPAGFTLAIPQAMVEEAGVAPELYVLREGDVNASGKLRLSSRALCVLKEHFDDPSQCA